MGGDEVARERRGCVALIATPMVLLLVILFLNSESHPLDFHAAAWIVAITAFSLSVFDTERPFFSGAMSALLMFGTTALLRAELGTLDMAAALGIAPPPPDYVGPLFLLFGAGSVRVAARRRKSGSGRLRSKTEAPASGASGDEEDAAQP